MEEDDAHEANAASTVRVSRRPGAQQKQPQRTCGKNLNLQAYMYIHVRITIHQSWEPDCLPWKAPTLAAPVFRSGSCAIHIAHSSNLDVGQAFWGIVVELDKFSKSIFRYRLP